jgi:hypothetical protein
MSRRRESARGMPRVTVTFDRTDRRYAPHDPLAVRYMIAGIDEDRVRAIEHSVLWYTEGKGEEDLGVHLFQRITDPAVLPPMAVDGSFGAHLPASPLSYEGVIVKVRWCVRVRLFFTGGRDFVSEHEFEVGSLPPAVPVAGSSQMGVDRA